MRAPSTLSIASDSQRTVFGTASRRCRALAFSVAAAIAFSACASPSEKAATTGCSAETRVRSPGLCGPVERVGALVLDTVTACHGQEGRKDRPGEPPTAPRIGADDAQRCGHQSPSRHRLDPSEQNVAKDLAALMDALRLIDQAQRASSFQLSTRSAGVAVPY